MPLHFSPVDQSELVDAYTPRPRAAFLMLQLGAGRSATEEQMTSSTRDVLDAMRFLPVTAADVRGTADYLKKIIDLIRGCGFGVAIYSDQTPARTMGNIFFELGVCGLMGKPVQLVVAGDRPTPSDFVRTEWIEYRPGEEAELRQDLRDSFCQIEELAEFYRTLGEVAIDAEAADLELAFERFKQAVLIADSPEARRRIVEIRDRLEVVAPRRRKHDDLASHRSRLLKAVREFLALLPAMPPP